MVTGRYPEPFTAKINQMMALTESDELKMLSVLTEPYDIDKYGKWGEAYMGEDGFEQPYSLPKALSFCWISYIDQTIYKTRLDIPEWARKEMLKPYEYYLEKQGWHITRYYRYILVGIAPGGNVTGWLSGGIRNPLIKFGTGVTQRIPQGSDICPNPFEDGEIPINKKAKDWVKKYGLPDEWQEKNNNITIGPDIRISIVPVVQP